MAVLLAACHPPRPGVPSGPLRSDNAPGPDTGPSDRRPPAVILVTLAGVRADSAQRFSRLLSEDTTWSGTLVAASSDPSAALSTLLRGSSAWHISESQPDGRPQSRPLSVVELFHHAGYRTRAHVPKVFTEAPLSLAAGADVLETTPDSLQEAAAAARLREGDFLWVHLPDGDLAYGRRRARQKMARQPVEGFKLHRLLRFADPRKKLVPARRALYERAYDEGLETVEVKLRRLLSRLRRHRLWSSTLLVVTGTYGTELGEDGQVLSGWNLGRTAIEVPLWVKWPASLTPPIRESQGARVAAARLWPTLAEAVGEKAAPFHLPPLTLPSSEPILSELYRGNGTNVFSLLDGDAQLLWTSRFAPSSPGYYRAQRALRTRRKDEMALMVARRLDARLQDAFERTLPLTGTGEPELRFFRWLPDGKVEELDGGGPAAAALRRRWMRFVPRERPPVEAGADFASLPGGGDAILPPSLGGP